MLRSLLACGGFKEQKLNHGEHRANRERETDHLDSGRTGVAHETFGLSSWVLFVVRLHICGSPVLPVV